MQFYIWRFPVRINCSGEDIDYHLPEDLENNPFDIDIPSAAGFTINSVKGIVHITNESGELFPDIVERYSRLDSLWYDIADLEYLQGLMNDGPL